LRVTDFVRGFRHPYCCSANRDDWGVTDGSLLVNWWTDPVAVLLPLRTRNFDRNHMEHSRPCKIRATSEIAYFVRVSDGRSIGIRRAISKGVTEYSVGG
jgi:hypothetical protein